MKYINFFFYKKNPLDVDLNFLSYNNFIQLYNLGYNVFDLKNKFSTCLIGSFIKNKKKLYDEINKFNDTETLILLLPCSLDINLKYKIIFYYFMGNLFYIVLLKKKILIL